MGETVGSLVATAISRLDRDQSVAKRPEADSTRPETADVGRPFLAGLHEAFDQLLQAGSATEIKQRLCDGLAAEDVFDHVRVVDVSSDGNLEVWGPHPERPDDRSELVNLVGGYPVEQSIRDVAAANGSTKMVRTEIDPQTTGPVESRNTDETVVVLSPIEYGTQNFGVLFVSSRAVGSFDSLVEEYISTLSDVAGFAVFAHKSRELVLSQQRVELEFEVTGPSCLAVPVSTELDCHCEIEHNTLTSDGDHLLYLRTDHPGAGDVIEVVETVESVTDCRPVWAGNGECLVEVVKADSGAEAMMGVGATILEASAENGTGTLVVEAPQSVETSTVVDAYTERNPHARLESKRTVDQPIQTPQNVQDPLEERLTEKQRAALFTAFHAGYFNWPRDSTAEEVASSLGVSSPTFQQHLRTALNHVVKSHASGVS